MAINSEKARTLRFEKGLCSEELHHALAPSMNYLGDFPHDNINRDLVKQACATNEPFCLIINTGDTGVPLYIYMIYILFNRANWPDVLLEDLISSIYMRDNFKANDALVRVLCENMLFNNNNANRINV